MSASPADRPSDSNPSPANTNQAPSGPDNTPRKPIRIGSQRYSEPKWGEGKADAPPSAAVAPVQAAPPVAPAAPAPEVKAESPVVAIADVADTIATPANAPPDADFEFERPQRKERAPIPVLPSTPELPNLRRLSPELEQEVEAALGGMSLEDVLKGSVAGGAVAGELEPETRRRATVAKIHRDDVFLQLPGHGQAVVSLRAFSQPPQEGDAFDVIIKRFNADEGFYDVSVPGAAQAVENWGDLAEGALVEARITAANTGGLECTVNNIRGFIPLSHISMYRVENTSEFLNQKLLCVVVEANPERRKLVLSRRAVLEREREEAKGKILESLEVGQTRDGVVRRLQDFGAFVDIGGVDGLVHVSQMSWDRIAHPSEVLAEGQKIQVRVEKIDKQTGKIGLSYRNTLESPWAKAEQKYPLNGVVKGKVSKLAEFGAFVKLEPGVEGLVHISELAWHRVSRANSVVNVGDEVEVKILSIDVEKQKLSLSLKQVKGPPETTKKKSEAEIAAEEAANAPAKPLPPKSNKPLKGGISRASGGDKFGLNW